jgi:DNA replicative helicase MCM subunit Mcm2 (Cdc46/Mcm family)
MSEEILAEVADRILRIRRRNPDEDPALVVAAGICITLRDVRPAPKALDVVCGICEREYEVGIPHGQLKLLECPKCRNSTLQMIRGS